jgi:hypothetical protein
VVSRSDSFRDETADLVRRHKDKDVVAEGTTRQRIDESERESRRDLSNLFLQVVRTNLDRAGS